jgi:putative membrane protein
MSTRLALLSTAAAALLLALPALAQQPTTGVRSALPKQELSQQDMNFMKEAAIGGMAEVELGKLAEQNAASQDVKQFGGRMVHDHSGANEQLTGIASRKSVQLPQNLDPQHAQIRDRLAQLRGAEFDRAYMRDMVKDHDEDIKAFRHEAQAGQDPDLRRFARETLAVIEQHDRMAHSIDSSLVGVGSSPAPRR